MAFGNSIPFLTSLVCSNVGSMSRQDISAISRSFQMLEVLDLGHPNLFVDGAHPNTAKALINLSLSTPRMREINLSSHSYISDNLFHNLLYNWRHNLEEVFICNCPNITHGIIFNSFSFPDAPPRVKSLVLSDTGLSQPNIPQPYFLNSLTTIKLFSCNISNQFLSSIKVLPLHTLLLGIHLSWFVRLLISAASNPPFGPFRCSLVYP
ncbi:putative leucine-rich repeat domain, L domain-containing protein [Medicago truncatula]|uniref:Putative leucine-rich repeat domain, L domain-containing protein n=1 Tax=Medicago truncatula TaxID=3880 RepID=A0A396HB20_MEDTR|nr:putative leucine-rich repeat domain, L domain-containing protein [Medicago truncatula]